MKALFLDLCLMCLFIILCFFVHGWFFYSCIVFVFVFYTLVVLSAFILYSQFVAKNLINRAGRRSFQK